jgi:PAS domain S-box-containing protein
MKVEHIQSLTEQEAGACLQYLAHRSTGDSALLPTSDIQNRHNATEATWDAQGQMADSMYRMLLEQLPIVTFMARLDGDFTEIYVSPQIEALLGFSQQEWVGNPVLWYERLHPEDKARWNIEFARFLMLDEPFRSVYRFMARDGHVVWVRGDVKIVRDAQGQPTAMQGIGYDITELKVAEEELQQAHEQLERRVEERTTQLAQANAALYQQAEELRRHQAEIEALNKRLQQAMTETHHRVKNSLQFIAALMDMHLYGPEETICKDQLRQLSQNIQALGAIHDLLTQQTKKDPQVEVLSVETVLANLLPLMQIMAVGRPVRFTVEERELPIHYSTTLAILVSELVSNAIKYGRGDVEVAFTVQDNIARLEVCDEGDGFAADFKTRVRVSTGLDLVESLVQLDLKGSAYFENRPAGGARVRIEFPLPD